MNVISKALSNTFYLFLDWGFSAFLGYLFWIILGKLLLPTDVGMFSTIINLGFLIVGLSLFGILPATLKLISEYHIKDDLNKIKGTVTWASKFLIGISLLIGLVFFIASSQIVNILGYLDVTSFQLLSFVVISLVLFYLSGNFLYALQKMKESFISNGLLNASKILMVLFFIYLGFGYIGAIVAFVLATVIFSSFRFKWIPFGNGEVEKKRIKEYAIPAFIGDFGRMGIDRASIFLLSIFAPMVSVGIFSLIFVLTTPMRLIPQVISAAIMPITSQQWTLENKLTLKKMVTQTLKYTLFLSIPAALVFIVYSREIILLLTTPEYLGAITIIPILAISYLFLGISAILVGFLYYTGKPKLSRNINVLSGIANIVLSIILIPTLGIIGAGIAFIISASFMLISSFYLTYKHLHFPLRKTMFAKNLLASILFLLTVITVNYINNSIIGIIISIVLASFIYIISLLYLKFFDELDLKILRELKTKVPVPFKRTIGYAENILIKFV